MNKTRSQGGINSKHGPYISRYDRGMTDLFYLCLPACLPYCLPACLPASGLNSLRIVLMLPDTRYSSSLLLYFLLVMVMVIELL